MAERCLDRRSAIFAKRQKAADAGKKDVVKAYDEEMDNLAAEAREYVEQAEREAEIRGLMSTEQGRTLAAASSVPNSTRSGEEGEWRGLLPSRDEFRALSESDPASGGFTVPSGTAAKYVDLLRNKAVFLKGIPAANVIRFTEKKFTLPVLSESDMPTLVQENALIPEGDDTWGGLEFDAKAYKDIRKASNEIMADSALNLREVVGQTMIRNCASEFDIDAFSGDGTTTPVLGIVGQGDTTPATVAGLPTHDDVADAVGRIWIGNAEPSVIWASPTAATALLKEREGSEGGYLSDDNPAALARRLPILVSNSVPTDTVVVADGSRIFAGIRQDVRIAISEHAAFENDQVVFRMTFRAAGLYVVEASSCQVLTANAG